MTVLTSMSIINMRWRPPRICFDDYERTATFSDLLPKQVFDDRLEQLNRLVRNKCPSSHTEYYVFVFIITCIACSAGFSLAARSADISMWYPLILLVIPAALSFWTSRRRASLVYRIKEFERVLKQTLREFNKSDRVRWSFRRPTGNDSIPVNYRTARLCLIVEISPEEEELPSYQAAVVDSSSSVYFPRGLPPPSYSEANMQQLLQPSSSSRIESSTVGTYPATCSSQTSLLPTIPEPALVRQDNNSSTACTPTRQTAIEVSS
ncbi:hypothetical protein BJV82DRAFT_628773 [Fennellomyces sp. T-0311]|nr:hypothetical protein BJV82DRAFT_628773 [Fennellomyces sp. T-0311]